MSNLEINKTYGLFDNPLNKMLIAQLKAQGETVLSFPQIEREKIELAETGENYLKNLTDFDWLILTDVLAVDFFIDRLRVLGVDFFDLDNLTVGTLGEAAADRLRFVQIHTDVIPSKINKEAVWSAISEYAGGDFDGLRFLIIGEESMDFPLTERLTEQNAIVIELPVYRARFTDESLNPKLITLLKGGAVDEFVFSMPEDLVSLRKLLPGDVLKATFADTQISASNENTFQALAEMGLRPLYSNHKKG
jgi:uroporphyrinogen-III synthase